MMILLGPICKMKVMDDVMMKDGALRWPIIWWMMWCPSLYLFQNHLKVQLIQVNFSLEKQLILIRDGSLLGGWGFEGKQEQRQVCAEAGAREKKFSNSQQIMQRASEGQSSPLQINQRAVPFTEFLSCQR
jgi:hypothetical protein